MTDHYWWHRGYFDKASSPLKIYIYSKRKDSDMAKNSFGNPEDPRRIRSSSRWIFLSILISMLALAFVSYFFRTDLLEKMGSGIMHIVVFSMSLGISFAIYRAVTITMKRFEEKR